MTNPAPCQSVWEKRLAALESEFQNRIGALEAEVRQLRTLVLNQAGSCPNMPVDANTPLRVDVRNTFVHVEDEQPSVGRLRTISAPLQARGNGEESRAPGSVWRPAFNSIPSHDDLDMPGDERGLPANASPPPGLGHGLGDKGNRDPNALQYLQGLGTDVIGGGAPPLSSATDTAAAKAAQMDSKRPVYVRKPSGEELKAAVLSHERIGAPYVMDWTVKNTFIEGPAPDEDDDDEPQPGIGGRSQTMPIATVKSPTDSHDPASGLLRHAGNNEGTMTQTPPGVGMPSAGSAGHPDDCQPCAWIWRTRTGGCTNGLNCSFCHLCDATELKKRRKAKIQRLRNERANERATGKSADAGADEDDADGDEQQPDITRDFSNVTLHQQDFQRVIPTGYPGV